MLFSIGIELPQDKKEAFGLVVPALCDKDYSCFSAADSEQEIPDIVKEAIVMVIESMIDDGISLSGLKDAGFIHYKDLEEYQHCDAWLMLDIDLSAFGPASKETRYVYHCQKIALKNFSEITLATFNPHLN